jgi:hydrogenase expression/formation protein HypC
MCLAIPGRIAALGPDGRLASVDVLGVRRNIDLSLLEDNPPAPGDWVLIHVGFAMSRIDEAGALEQLRLLEELGDAGTAIEEARGYDIPEP